MHLDWIISVSDKNSVLTCWFILHSNNASYLSGVRKNLRILFEHDRTNWPLHNQRTYRHWRAVNCLFSNGFRIKQRRSYQSAPDDGHRSFFLTREMGSFWIRLYCTRVKPLSSVRHCPWNFGWRSQWCLWASIYPTHQIFNACYTPTIDLQHLTNSPLPVALYI